MKSIKVTMEDGRSFCTSINSAITQEQLNAYYVGRYYVEENQITGKETFTKFVKVEFVRDENEGQN